MIKNRILCLKIEYIFFFFLMLLTQKMVGKKHIFIKFLIFPTKCDKNVKKKKLRLFQKEGYL